MPLIQITTHLQKDTLKKCEQLRDTVLQDDELTFFRINTGSKNSWFRWIFQIGVYHAEREVEAYKKRLLDGKP